MNFFQSNKKNDIRVEFVNVDTGKIFTVSDVLPENLPDTFAINTTMHLGPEDWDVVSAEPVHKSDFLKTRKLRLVLRRVLLMDPKRIMFTFPSICNYLGELVEERRTGNELIIHEDNWRNIEIVSRRFENDIDSDLREIYKVHQEERVDAGFKRLYIREKIEFPLFQVDISFSEIESLFKIDRKFSGLSYDKGSGIVKDGFAFQTQGGIVFYGRRQGSDLREFCVVHCVPNDKLADDVNILEIFMTKYNLCFVDWCRVLKETSPSKNLVRYFSEVFGK